jgi:hypothetical protein
MVNGPCTLAAVAFTMLMLPAPYCCRRPNTTCRYAAQQHDRQLSHDHAQLLPAPEAHQPLHEECNSARQTQTCMHGRSCGLSLRTLLPAIGDAAACCWTSLSHSTTLLQQAAPHLCIVLLRCVYVRWINVVDAHIAQHNL